MPRRMCAIVSGLGGDGEGGGGAEDRDGGIGLVVAEALGVRLASGGDKAWRKGGVVLLAEPSERRGGEKKSRRHGFDSGGRRVGRS